mgnify:CR=1 FL=1
MKACFFLILIVIVPYTFSCTSDLSGNNQIRSNVTLSKSSTELKLPLDISTAPKTNCMKYYQTPAGEEYLFFLNKPINSIQIYDLKHKNLYKKIQIDKQGENGMGQIAGLTIKSMDSIFVASSGRPILYLTDTTGLVKGKLDFRTPVDSRAPSYSRLVSKYNKDLVFWSDEMILSQPLHLNGRQPTKELLEEHRMFLRIDSKSGKYQFSPISMPRDYYKDDQMYSTTYSVAFDGEKLVWSILCDHSIYFSTDLNNVQKKSAPSTYIDEFMSIKGAASNPYWYFAKNPFYASIYYDSFREVYYRFAKHDYDELNEIGEMQGYYYPPIFSVQILDKDLNMIGETAFDGNKYNMFNAFVGEEGLYISKANPLREDFNEDFLEFEIYTISDEI